ncbi:hypothetical protein OIU78_028489 [Salix suchowensis]|nr:hypothetical protein OIU78_028489 [Salix suchowensis]
MQLWWRKVNPLAAPMAIFLLAAQFSLIPVFFLSCRTSTDMYQFLDGYNASILQFCFVHVTKTSRAYKAIIVKAICCFNKICKSELPQRLRLKCGEADA